MTTLFLRRAAITIVLPVCMTGCGGGGGGGGSAAASSSGTSSSLTVTPVMGFTASDKTFSAGSVHSLVIKSGGSLYSWGSNLEGQLGSGTANASQTPVAIPTGNTATWSMVSAGAQFSLGLRSDGTLWSWGYNIDGQLGLGALSNATVTAPTKITLSSSLPKDIAAGDSHALVVLTDNSMWSWGRNANGQLGINTTSDAFIPTQIGIAKTWDAVSAGGAHSLAKQKTTNYLYAWGANANGQLAQITTTDAKVPVQVNLLVPATVAVFSAGGTHSLAIPTDGTLWGWGGNGCGQVGDGTQPPTPPFSTPTVTTYDHTAPFSISTTTDWARVAAGGFHSLAIKKNGALYSWGCNQYGQLGNGTQVDSNTPTQVGTDLNWVAVFAGQYHSMAVKSDGSLWVWGRNDQGQLGLGTLVSPYLSPTQLR